MYEEVEKFCKEHDIVLKTHKNDFRNSQTKLDIICKCGKSANMIYSRIRETNGTCRDCGYERARKATSKSYEEVVMIFKNNNCTLLTEYYENNKQKLKFICSCGNIYIKRLDEYLKSPICYKCSIENRSVTRRIKFDKVKSFFSTKELVLITKENEYKDVKSMLSFICKCGELCSKRFSALIREPEKCMCNKCLSNASGYNTKFPYQYVYEFIRDYNCELITTENDFVNSQNKIEIKCKCGEIFITKFCYFKNESKRQCNKCGIKLKSGENHPFWNGGVTSEGHKIRNSNEYSEWRLSVFVRDNFTCQCCNDNSKSSKTLLQVHHLLNFSDHPDLRLDLNNGIVLCKNCHDFSNKNSFHNIYGTRNNTPEQLEEYIKRYKSGEFNLSNNVPTEL